MTDRYLEIKKTRDFGEKLNATFEFIKLNFKPLLTAVAQIAGPAILITSAAYIMYMEDLNQLMQSIQTDLGGFGINLIINVFLYLFLFFVSYILLIQTVLQYMNLYIEKRTNDISPAEVWNKVKSHFFDLFFAYFFIVIFIFVLALILGFLVGASAGNLFFTFLFVIVFLIVIMYVSISLSLFNNIMISENKRITDFSTALSRCFYLVKGKWWSTFGIILVASLVVSMVGGILQAPVTFGQLFSTLSQMDNPDEFTGLQYATWQVVYLGIVQAVQQFLSIISVVAISFQYFNLVERKEASGLMDRISSISPEETPRNDNPNAAQDKEDDEHY